MSTSVRRLARGDGRELAWIECGDPRGTPVLYCHGFPSSGREALFAAAAARSRGLRLIAPDRPGYGDSTPQPGRGLDDWPRDAVALLDHLGVGRAPVLGISGGAPYALACLALQPDRFTRAATAGGLGPMSAPEHSAGMSRLNRLSIHLARRDSRFQAWLFRLLRLAIRYQPERMFPILAWGAPPADQRILRDRALRATWQAAARHGLRQGADAAIAELRLYVRPWPFDPGAIAARVDVWHGAMDRVVPVVHARTLARLLPRNSLHVQAGHGHFSLPVELGERILASLTEPGEGVGPEPGPA